MASKAMDRLMDNIRTRVPGALDSAITAEIFVAVDKLCRFSNCWTERFQLSVTPAASDPVLVPDDYTYQVYPPSGASCVRLLWLLNADAAPVRANMLTPGYIRLQASPNEPATYTANIALTVTDPTDREGYPVLPDWIIDRHNDTLLHGTLAMLMSQPAKPYTATQMALFHGSAFRSGISAARIEADRANTYRAQAWTFPQSFANRR